MELADSRHRIVSAAKPRVTNRGSTGILLRRVATIPCMVAAKQASSKCCGIQESTIDNKHRNCYASYNSSDQAGSSGYLDRRYYATSEIDLKNSGDSAGDGTHEGWSYNRPHRGCIGCLQAHLGSQGIGEPIGYLFRLLTPVAFEFPALKWVVCLVRKRGTHWVAPHSNWKQS